MDLLKDSREVTVVHDEEKQQAHVADLHSAVANLHCGGVSAGSEGGREHAVPAPEGNAQLMCRPES